MPDSTFSLSRRRFVAGAAGSSLVMGLGTLLPGCGAEQVASDLADAGASAYTHTAIEQAARAVGEFGKPS